MRQAPPRVPAPPWHAGPPTRRPSPVTGLRLAVVAALAVVVLVVLVVTVGGGSGAAPASLAPRAQTPSAPAVRQPARVLRYLDAISGTATVAGQHNREPLRTPALWTDRARALTGSYPGLWGSDFAFTDVQERPAMVDEAVRQWRSGALVTLMWHMCPPGRGQVCDWERDVQSRLDDDRWRELTTDGSALNRAWKQQLDAAVPSLLRLRDAGVEVLWRPDHELNDPWAWWGGRPGPDGSSKLFRMTRDYFDAKGLTNLVWVWSVKDVGVDRLADYWPGDAYVDVVGLDAWMKPFPDPTTYAAVLKVAGPRPVALTEVGAVPTTAQLAAQPRWTWFMVWAEMLRRSSPTLVQHTYADARVLTRDEVSLPAA